MTFEESLPRINEMLAARQNSFFSKEDWQDISQNIRVYFWKKWKYAPKVDLEKWLNQVITRQMRAYIRHYNSH